MERVKWLLEGGANPNELLLLTFTNHAARVMVDRIQEEVDTEVHASTFHSFCYGVLRDYLPVGRSRFTVADEDDQRKILRRLGGQRPPAAAARYINRLKSSGTMEGDELYSLYEAYLLEHNLIDFGGLQTQALEYIPILDKYRHIMVDEFHDTSPVQMMILEALEPVAETITIVCDDQQSIYSWRGADIQNILSFQDKYPGAKVINLERNYRSTKSIVTIINNLISHATEKLEDKTLYSRRKYGKDVNYTSCTDVREEAKLVASRVEDSPGNNLILYRTNAQSRALEEALLSLGIPYRLVAATSFYRRKEIKDAIAYLRWIYNPKDEVALTRICNTPRRGIGKATIRAMIDKYGSLCNAVSSGDLAVLGNIRDAVAGYDTVPTILREVLKLSGYMGMIYLDTTPDGMDRALNINALIEGAMEFNTQPDPTLGNYMRIISLISDSDMYNEDEMVQMMTIHASKGMECRNVHIVGVNEGIIPHKLSIFEDNVGEERRLMYVAISRAKDMVYMTSIQSGYNMGKFVTYSRSRFLREMNEV